MIHDIIYELTIMLGLHYLHQKGDSFALAWESNYIASSESGLYLKEKMLIF